MGKIIYEARNKAAEYGKYAFSAYHSCSNGCRYCYLRKGVFAKTMGGNTPKLKACFKDEAHALEVFEKELLANLPELQEHGLFFSFTTDPLLPETRRLTMKAGGLCAVNKVPVKLLTKRVDWLDITDWTKLDTNPVGRTFQIDSVAIGFTLTGHDELEPNASTNAERIEAMRKLHDAGFRTFASIEPIVDIESSFEMIFDTAGFCDLYKVGLMSGKKYKKEELLWLIDKCNVFSNVYKEHNFPIKFYLKDSFLEQAGVNRSKLSNNFVTRDYNIFTNK